MTPCDCTKYQTWSAPIRPLDLGSRRAVHLPGERICAYLLVSGKAGAEEHYRHDPAFRVVLPLVVEVCDRHGGIRRAVERAARYGIRRGGFRAAGDGPQAA